MKLDQNLFMHNTTKPILETFYFRLTFWNIGEILGVFDRAHRQKRITRKQLDEIMDRFYNETARLKKISRMRIITLSESILESSWDVLIKT